MPAREINAKEARVEGRVSRVNPSSLETCHLDTEKERRQSEEKFTLGARQPLPFFLLLRTFW